MKDKIFSFLNRNETAVQATITFGVIAYGIFAYGECMYTLGQTDAFMDATNLILTK